MTKMHVTYDMMWYVDWNITTHLFTVSTQHFISTELKVSHNVTECKTKYLNNLNGVLNSIIHCLQNHEILSS